MDAAGAGTWHWDRRSGVVDWDPALEALYGLPEGGFGRTYDDWVACIHPEDRPHVLETLEATLRTGERHHVVYRTVRPDGETRWIEGRGQVLVEDGEIIGIVGACQDITERQKAEVERDRLIAAEREARERLGFLAEAGGVLARSLDVEQTVRALARLAVPRLGDWCVVDLTEGELVRHSTVEHEDPAMVELAKGLRRRFGSWMDRAEGRRLLGDGYLPDIDDGFLQGMARDEDHLEALRRIGPRSAILVPLEARSRQLGVLGLVHADSGRRHSREDHVLARELAHRAAVAIDNGRLFSERSRVARVLQRALLPPELPSIPEVELASSYDPAEANEIGGDFYDVMGSGSDWMLIIGDVRGKGTEAASLASLARHTARAAALRDLDPRHVLGVLNDALVEHDPEESFCTAVCAHLRTSGGGATLSFAAGGHPPPLLLRADGELQGVEVAGTLIGLFPEAVYRPTTVTLRPGDLLFFYTDGLSEARRDDELFGVERIAEALRGAPGMTAEATLKHVRDTLEAFHTRQRDDIALLALRLLPDG